jgi:hypothetical protein
MDKMDGMDNGLSVCVWVHPSGKCNRDFVFVIPSQTFSFSRQEIKVI